MLPCLRSYCRLLVANARLMLLFLRGYCTINFNNLLAVIVAHLLKLLIINLLIRLIYTGPIIAILTWGVEG